MEMKKQHSDWRQGVSHEKFKKEDVNACSALIDFVLVMVQGL